MHYQLTRIGNQLWYLANLLYLITVTYLIEGKQGWVSLYELFEKVYFEVAEYNEQDASRNYCSKMELAAGIYKLLFGQAPTYPTEYPFQKWSRMQAWDRQF